LIRIMRHSFAAVEAAMKSHKTDMRTAALVIGVKRVADATVRRGIFP
jgi:glutamate dehydrogenase (NAD(P)+)